jgi:hypothetical protein
MDEAFPSGAKPRVKLEEKLTRKPFFSKENGNNYLICTFKYIDATIGAHGRSQVTYSKGTARRQRCVRRNIQTVL